MERRCRRWKVGKGTKWGEITEGVIIVDGQFPGEGGGGSGNL